MQPDDALRTRASPRRSPSPDSALVFVARIASRRGCGVERPEDRLLEVEVLERRLDDERRLGRRPRRASARRAAVPSATVDPLVDRVGVELEPRGAAGRGPSRIRSRPRSIAAGIESWSTPRSPASSATWAIPAPIVPAPTIPTIERAAPIVGRAVRSRRGQTGLMPRTAGGSPGSDSGCRHCVGPKAFSRASAASRSTGTGRASSAISWHGPPGDARRREPGAASFSRPAG